MTGGAGRKWSGPALVFGASYLFAAVIYIAASGRGFGGDDWGDFVTAASVLGIAHPTGYPVYLQILALPLLVSPRAWAPAAADVANALLVAAAPALLALWAYRAASAKKREPGAVAFAIALGGLAAVAPSLWAKGTAVETYGAALAALFGALCLLQAADRANDSRFSVIAALGCGLALGVHLSAFTYGAVALVVWFVARRPPARVWAAALAAAALGFSAYLYLPLRGTAATPVIWAGTGDAGAFFHHVLGRQFTHNLRWPSWFIARAGLSDDGAALWRNAGPLLLLTPLGFWAVAKRSRSAALALGVILACNLFYLLFYDVPDVADYRLSFIGVSLALGAAGALALYRALPRKVFQTVAVAGALAAVAATGAREWPGQKRDTRFLDYYGRELVAAMGYRGVFFAGLTTSNFLAQLSRYYVGLRPDLQLYNSNDERLSMEKLQRELATALGDRPVYADYIFILFQEPDEARRQLFRQARPAGFIVEITERATPPAAPSAHDAAVLRETRAIIPRSRPDPFAAPRGDALAAATWVYHGIYHQYRGEYGAALFYLGRAAAYAPYSPVTQNNLAAYFLERREFGKAARAARAALAAEPTSYAAYTNLTRAALGLREYDAAVRYARAAVASKPNDGATYRLEAYAYLARGDRKAAIPALERAVKLGRKETPTLLLLAQLYREVGDEGKALELLAGETAASADPTLWRAYAALLAEEGRDEEARRALDKAGPRYP